jgi:hypothetical protein
MAIDMATTVSTSPKLLSAGIDISPLAEEEVF